MPSLTLKRHLYLGCLSVHVSRATKACREYSRIARPELTEQQLKELLSAELQIWARKPFAQLVAELSDVQGYERGADDCWHQFEVMLVENTPEYIHVLISVDDGSIRWACSPITSGFIVTRTGALIFDCSGPDPSIVHGAIGDATEGLADNSGFVLHDGRCWGYSMSGDRARQRSMMTQR